MTRDYVPLDLTSLYNAGVEVFDPSRYDSGGTYLEPRPVTPPIGEQRFHGIPFQIGRGADRCVIQFGPDLPPRHEVRVEQAAHSIIFAHAIIRTDLWEGGPVGLPVATYTVRFIDGSTIEIPIRERFEIGHVPVPWGQYPFLAVPDQKDHLLDRHEGRWERVGFRITEVGWAVPQGYYLWAWRNPRPELHVDRVDIEHLRGEFVVAAVTIGAVDEDPFPRHARRPVVVSLIGGSEESSGGPLVVDVDRGTATYTHPLPAPAAMSVDDPMRGFGVERVDDLAVVYTEVAASSSATLTVSDADQVVAVVNWRDVERGVVENGAVRVEISESGRNWVRVEVVDEDTGKPVPCRIAFHSPAGVPYPPHGHHDHVFSGFESWNMDVGADVRLGHFTYAFIDGRCEGWLPRGRVLVDIARGYEYQPFRGYVEIEPGQQYLRLVLRRWIDMRALGWWSGDTHVHFLSPTGALNEARSEDLSVVNLLMAQWGHHFSNIEDFTGDALSSEDRRHVVWVSQENRQHILGHLGLLGLRRPVMPMSSGGPSEGELGGSLETTLSHWADAARAQGATVVASHLPTPNGEPAALIATGRVDAVEMLDFLAYEHAEYYRYLNAGYQLPLVAGTDKMANTTPVGLYRTYVHLEEDTPFSFESWMAGLRAGRTFVSGGVLVSFEVDGRGPGAEIEVGRGGTVEVRATARSIFPLHSLQIVEQGRVVASSEVIGNGEFSLEINERIRVDGDTWLAARCAGPGYTAMRHHDDRRRGVFGHSSPVYVRTGPSYGLRHRASVDYMLRLVEGSLEHIRHRSRQYPAATTTHHHGGDHSTFLEGPFLEARDMLQQLLEEGA